MYQRQLPRALTHNDVQEILDAELYAEKRGKRINTVVTVHPKLLDQRLPDMGCWVSWLTNKIRIFCIRDRGFGYFALWVRENYSWEDREQLHILIYVPSRHKAALEDALRRWLPGDPRAVKLTEPEYDHKHRDRYGRPVNKALTYLLKQMTPQARFALKAQGMNVRRERRCRKTGAPVAPVFGKRWGVSRSLNAKASRELWNPPMRATCTRQVAVPKAAAEPQG